MMEDNFLFQELDRAEDLQALESWLFQDDKLQGLGFCHEVKDLHSLSFKTADCVPPPSMTLQDFPDGLDTNLDIGWDQSFNYPDPLLLDVKYETLQQQQQLLDEPSAEIVTHQFEDQIINKEIVFADQQQHVVRSSVQQYQVNNFSQGFDIPSPQEFNIHDAGNYECSSKQTPFAAAALDKFGPVGASPCIISVSLTDAIPIRKPRLRKINISSIQVLGNEQKAFIHTNNHFTPVTVKPLSIETPKTVVINVNRATQSSENIVMIEPVEFTEDQTLKEILRSDGDDLMRQLMEEPIQGLDLEEMNSIHISSSDEDDCEYISSSPQTDSEISLYDSSCSETLSPARSESCIDDGYRIDSPEPCVSLSEDTPTLKSTSRSSPYSIEERKLRKKEQNRHSATRYRQKRKIEELQISSELEHEKKREKLLKEKYDALAMEVKFMKKLLRDVLLMKKAQ